MGRFDEGMGRVDPEMGEYIKNKDPYRNPVRVKLVRLLCVAAVLMGGLVWFKYIR